MAELRVVISRFVDEHEPGFVECTFDDAQGDRHCFVEKVPIVSAENLWSDSAYPKPGAIRCRVEAEWDDARGRTLARVSTEHPDGVESTSGLTKFVVLASQVEP